jgi:hypothetical protein
VVGKPSQGKATDKTRVNAINPNMSRTFDLDNSSLSEDATGFKTINSTEKIIPSPDNQYGKVWKSALGR